MKILNPWALFSLVSLIILLLIYILKPNFQQKMVSSTFVWKLSLKYKKKRLPINRIRNLLLIICQVLILTLLTIVLIKPVKVIATKTENEVILILDSSASMRTTSNGEKRYDRAIDLIKKKANEIFDLNGIVSIVNATNEPNFLFERTTASSRWDVEDTLDTMKKENACTYGTTNLDEATSICQKVIAENPDALIYVYTDRTVSYVTPGLNIVDVKVPGEYNVAILNAYAEMVDNYYSYIVELACYGVDKAVDLKMNVYGAKSSESSEQSVDLEFVEKSVQLSNDSTYKVIFTCDRSDYVEDENTMCSEIAEIFEYDSIYISVNVNDNFPDDNTFNIYGGKKEVINVLYASSARNGFFSTVIDVLASQLKDRYVIYKKEIIEGEVPNSGYDLYIYEETMMPNTAPNDGVVLYVNPLTKNEISGSDFRISGEYTTNRALELIKNSSHPLLNHIDDAKITVTRYLTLSSGLDKYEPLLSGGKDPLVLLQDNENKKSLLILFSVHYSNLPIIKEFPLFMRNIFDYFLPSTIDNNYFEINDSVEIRSRSNEIVVTGNSQEVKINSFPNKLSLDLPGTYTISQTTYFGKNLTEKIYVKIPQSESNILEGLDTIVNPIMGTKEIALTKDIIFWLAVGLCSLVFIEWIIKGKDTI